MNKLEEDPPQVQPGSWLPTDRTGPYRLVPDAAVYTDFTLYFTFLRNRIFLSEV